ncbi:MULTISPECIES: hypothetical protein [Rhodococcus]|uniref:hypothetical protein n=1 Tax=Rhodococcus TaxID=1827 RepID=UPI00067E9990|nr:MULTISPECIES: hypothetical protein [Rhodococcus]MCT6735953.1 hypothetical protein [Rhodococcus qingshengii]MEA1793826.1 hypothetical protein [Rhodococcus qingshengii]
MVTNTIRYGSAPTPEHSMAALVTAAGVNGESTTTSVTTLMITTPSFGALHLVNSSNLYGDWIVPPADYILPNTSVNVVATSDNENDFPIVLTYRSDDGGIFIFSASNSKSRADTSGTFAPDDHDVTVTMTSGYPSMNVTYVLR